MMTQEEEAIMSALIEDLEGKSRIMSHQTDILFNLHNKQYPDIKEFGKSCTSCRERVYNRMKNWHKNKPNT